MSDEAFLLSGIIIDGLVAALIRSPSASKRRLSQGRPLAFGWLAAERLVAHPREPGTLITALTHSQLSASPLLLCLLPPSREERLLLFHTHLLVLSSSRRRLLSVPSLFGTLSPRSFTLPLPVRSPSTLCLCAHVACCFYSQLRVVVCPTHLYLFISSINSLTISSLLGCVFLPSASLRTRKYSSLFHLYVPLTPTKRPSLSRSRLIS